MFYTVSDPDHYEEGESYSDYLCIGEVDIGIDIGSPYNKFNAELRPNTCCGIVELKNFCFDMFDDEIDQNEFNNHFQAAMRTVGEKYRKGFVHLTLSRRSDGAVVQPSYFVRTLEAYPGAIPSNWRYNPNSGNYIQFWVLPV